MFIGIGMQCGYKTDKRFGQYHILLNRIFNQNKEEPCIHFKTLHEFSIIFRIGAAELPLVVGRVPNG